MLLSENSEIKAISTKKTWGNGPQLTLMSAVENVTGGTKTTTHEANFTPIPSQPGRFYLNGSGNYASSNVNNYMS